MYKEKNGTSKDPTLTSFDQFSTIMIHCASLANRLL